MFKINSPFLSQSTSRSWLGASALVVGSCFFVLPAIAGQAPSGQTFFDHPPTLVRAATSSQESSVPSTYEFTVKIPENAGISLKAVKIVQRENLEMIRFDMAMSRAFVGQRFAAGPELLLASVGGEQPATPNEVLVVFDHPVQPGSTVTVALKARSNPAQGGIYLFGVTAYPDGEDGLGQFLGYGRVHFSVK